MVPNLEPSELNISCHYRHLTLTEDIWLKSSTRAGKSTLAITGRKRQEKQTISDFVSLTNEY